MRIARPQSFTGKIQNRGVKGAKGRIGIGPTLASLTTYVVHIMNVAFIEELTLELQTTAALYLAIQTKQHKGTDPSLRLSFRIPLAFFGQD